MSQHRQPDQSRSIIAEKRRDWAIQRTAQRLLRDVKPKLMPSGNTIAVHVFRVASCHRGTDGGPVEVLRAPDGSNARYKGVQTCGSVWHCTLCAPKIAAERRREGWDAGMAWRDSGGDVYFVTRTLQHNVERFGQGKLVDQLVELSDALSQAKGSRAFRKLMAACGVKGTIRALEITFGEINGWHAHTHEIVFASANQLARIASIRKETPKKVSAKQATRRRANRAKKGKTSPTTSLVGQWARVLIQRDLAGLKPGDIGPEKFRKLRALLKRCLTVQSANKAFDYLIGFGANPGGERTGWGAMSELTHSHMKNGKHAENGVPHRCRHASPWGLLNDAHDGDARSGALFREYAEAVQGSRQLYWSRGLKEFFFGVVDRTDDEIAADPDARCDEHVIEITPLMWRVVLSRNARWEVLQAAAMDGRAGVERVLERIQQAPQTHSGEFTESGTFFVPLRAKAAA